MLLLFDRYGTGRRDDGRSLPENPVPGPPPACKCLEQILPFIEFSCIESRIPTQKEELDRFGQSKEFGGRLCS
jgi:hypothetical protein